MRKIKIVHGHLVENSEGQPICCPVTGGTKQCYELCAWFSTDSFWIDDKKVSPDVCSCQGTVIGEIIQE